MGWLFTEGMSRKELIKERTQDWKNESHLAPYTGHEGHCLAHCVRGNVIWLVWSIVKNGKETDRYIGCDLMKKSDGDWGYKDMDESSGPCYYTCPIKYFDMVPEPDSKFAKEWRITVRAYHKKNLDRQRERRAFRNYRYMGV